MCGLKAYQERKNDARVLLGYEDKITLAIRLFNVRHVQIHLKTDMTEIDQSVLKL